MSEKITGLFLLVINADIINIKNARENSVKADGFWRAMLFSIIFSVISSLLERLGKHDESTRNLREEGFR